MECPFTSEIVHPHTSAMQVSAGPSTYPVTQDTEFSVKETVPMLQAAVAVLVPMVSPVPESTGLVTEELVACASAGTEYPFVVPDPHPVGVQDCSPSTRGSDGVPAGSRTSPATEPDIHTGYVPEILTDPPAGGIATTWNQES